MDQIEKRIPSPADLAAILRMHPVEILIERLECACYQLDRLHGEFRCSIEVEARDHMECVMECGSGPTERTLEELCDDVADERASNLQIVTITVIYAQNAAQGIAVWLEYGQKQAGWLETAMRTALHKASEILYQQQRSLYCEGESSDHWRECTGQLESCLARVRAVAPSRITDSEVRQRLESSRGILSMSSEISNLFDERRELLREDLPLIQGLRDPLTDSQEKRGIVICDSLDRLSDDLQTCAEPNARWLARVLDAETPYDAERGANGVSGIVDDIVGYANSGNFNEETGHHEVLTNWQRKMLTGLIEAGATAVEPAGEASTLEGKHEAGVGATKPAPQTVAADDREHLSIQEAIQYAKRFGAKFTSDNQLTREIDRNADIHRIKAPGKHLIDKEQFHDFITSDKLSTKIKRIPIPDSLSTMTTPELTGRPAWVRSDGTTDYEMYEQQKIKDKIDQKKRAKPA